MMSKAEAIRRLEMLREQWEQTNKTIERLTDRRRELFVRAYDEAGLNTVEIAEIFGVSAEAVRQVLHRMNVTLSA
jgi:RNA polymerase sigma factor (sigma-70 family)